MKRATLVGVLGMFALLAVLACPQALALGVAPSRDVRNFAPGDMSVQLSIINTNHESMKVVIYAEGDLADYVTIPTPTLSFKEDETEKTITYTVKVPGNLGPGKHEIDVIVLELPSTFLESDQNTIITDEQTMIGATTAIVHQLFINVPYPGRYAEGNLFISAGNVGETVTFTISVSNKGTEQITAQGRVRILGPTNEEIASVQAEPIKVGSGAESKAVMNWQADVNPGVYTAEAILNYEDKQFKVTRQFTIGNNQVTIKDLKVDDFKLGEIAKLDIQVENEWNQKAENVYALVKIVDGGGSVLSQFTTSTISMNPQSTATLYGYWETQDVTVGTYTIDVILNFGGKQVERFFGVVVGIDSLNVKDFSKIGGQVVKGKGEGSNSTALLVIIIVVLILVNVGWFVYLRRRKQ